MSSPPRGLVDRIDRDVQPVAGQPRLIVDRPPGRDALIARRERQVQPRRLSRQVHARPRHSVPHPRLGGSSRYGGKIRGEQSGVGPGAPRHAGDVRCGELERDERIPRPALVRRGRELDASEVRVAQHHGDVGALARRNDPRVQAFAREERLVQRRDARRVHLNLKRPVMRAVGRDLAERTKAHAGRAGLSARRRRNRAVHAAGEQHGAAIAAVSARREQRCEREGERRPATAHPRQRHHARLDRSLSS